jgi:hypothetical protein
METIAVTLPPKSFGFQLQDQPASARLGLVDWVGSLELCCCRLEDRRSRIHSSASVNQYSISFLAAAAR